MCLRPGVSVCLEWPPSSCRYLWLFPVLELLTVVCSPLGGILQCIFCLISIRINIWTQSINVVFNYLDITICPMSLWVLEFLLMKNSWDKKTQTPPNPKNKTKERWFAQNLHVSYTCKWIFMKVLLTSCIWTQSLVCTLNVSCLNTIISLYSERLTFKHHCCRLCFAAAREGHFPQVFSYISLNRKTPLPSIILTVSLW